MDDLKLLEMKIQLVEKSLLIILKDINNRINLIEYKIEELQSK